MIPWDRCSSSTAWWSQRASSGRTWLYRGPQLRFTEDRNVSFLYQLSHHQRPRALTHGVRIDAVAGAVAHFQRAMLMDVDQAVGMIR